MKTAEPLPKHPEIAPILFISWDEQSFPEHFQELPQTSVALPGALAASPPQTRADIHLRIAGKNRFLIRNGDLLALAEIGRAQPLISFHPGNKEQGEVLIDFALAGEEVFALVQGESGFVLHKFSLDGQRQQPISLSTTGSAKSYQKLLTNGSNLYLVGNSAPSATFLDAPTLFQVRGGAVESLHQWKGEKLSDLFIDAKGQFCYAKPIDRLLYGCRFDLENKSETYTEEYEKAAYPYLRLPIGVLDNSEIVGRSGLKAGRVGMLKNDLRSEFEIGNLFLSAEKVCYSVLDQDTLHIFRGQKDSIVNEISLVIPSDVQAQYKVRNWKLVGFDASGDYLAEGFAAGGPPLQLRFDSQGNLVGKPIPLAKQLGHRMMAPAFWCVGSGEIYVAVSGDVGLRVFGLRF